MVDGELAVGKVTELTVTFDHSVCDGGTATGFLRFIADAMENPGPYSQTSSRCPKTPSELAGPCQYSKAESCASETVIRPLGSHGSQIGSRVNPIVPIPPAAK